MRAPWPSSGVQSGVQQIDSSNNQLLAGFGEELVPSAILSSMHSKEAGNQFENILTVLCRAEGLLILRIPDACRTVGKNRIIRIKSPFDYIIRPLHQGDVCSAYIDAKTTQSKTYCFSTINRDQMLTLLSMEQAGAVAGFIVWFREIDRLVFYSSSTLWKIVPGESLLPEDGLDLGSTMRSNISRIFHSSP